MKSENCTNETEPAGGGGPLAIAIERGDWERVALYVFVGIAETLRSEPEATIDDLLALLEAREATDER